MKSWKAINLFDSGMDRKTRISLRFNAIILESEAASDIKCSINTCWTTDWVKFIMDHRKEGVKMYSVMLSSFQNTRSLKTTNSWVMKTLQDQAFPQRTQNFEDIVDLGFWHLPRLYKQQIGMNDEYLHFNDQTFQTVEIIRDWHRNNHPTCRRPKNNTNKSVSW